MIAVHNNSVAAHVFTNGYDNSVCTRTRCFLLALLTETKTLYSSRCRYHYYHYHHLHYYHHYRYYRPPPLSYYYHYHHLLLLIFALVFYLYLLQPPLSSLPLLTLQLIGIISATSGLKKYFLRIIGHQM